MKLNIQMYSEKYINELKQRDTTPVSECNDGVSQMQVPLAAQRGSRTGRQVYCMFLAATKQLYEWFSPSVCPSVRPSVRHTFLTMFPSSYHHEIFRSYYQWQKWRPCKRSRSEVKGQSHRGHNPILPFPDCNSSLNSHMMMKWCI